MIHLKARHARILVCCCLVFGACNVVSAQQPEPAVTDSQQQLKLWREVYVELAQWHTFSVGRETPEESSFRPQPLHTYANPAGGSESHGSIFVWTRDNRPVVIGALWSLVRDDIRQVKASIHAASSDELTGWRKGEQFWHPRQKFQMINWPVEAHPAETPLKRLVQMRNMIRGIEAIRTAKDQQSRLRSLPQPLYRYKNDRIIDGAVFGFFENWDPEVLLLIEISAEQPDQWKAGMIRLSDKKLEVGYQDEMLWQYDPEGDEPRLGGADFLYISQTIDQRPAIIEPPNEVEAK